LIFKSPHPDLSLPEMSLSDVVLQKAQKLGEKPAFIDGLSGRTITYSQMRVGVERMAAALIGKGLRKGDVLALFSPNLPEYAIAFNAAALAGAAVTTANPLSSVDDLAHQLAETQSKFVITVSALLTKVKAAIQKTAVQEIFLFDTFDNNDEFISVKDLMESKEPLPKVIIDPKEDLVALPYSSGTTGLPKGVMLTHSNIVSNISQFLSLQNASESDIVLSVLPFFHIYGMTVIVNGMMAIGATAVTLPQFEVERYLRTLQDYKVTQTYVAPPLVLLLAKHPLVDKFDLSSLRLIYSGAAPLDADLSEACATRLKCAVTQGYGMTEASPGISTGYADNKKNKAGTVGQLLPNTSCRLIDLVTKEDVGIGQEGELWVQGPQVMKGYFKNPAETAKMLDEDQWLHTGDVASIDSDGFLRVLDRVKELIKYKGFQVAPAELEGLLLSHPSVADAAVIPSPDNESGEVPIALVVKKGSVSENELIDFVAEKVTSYKRIREVVFVDSIPKSAAGKILRRELIEQQRQKLKLAALNLRRLEDRVTLEKCGSLLLIGLDRPNKLNAFDIDMFRGLSQAITEMDQDGDIRCGVLFANGPAFTAGLDLASALPVFAQGQEFLAQGNIDPWAITERPVRRKPLVLALHGRCFTLGIELALASDIVVAADTTRFCQMEVSRGIIPFGGATIRLPAIAGWSNAMRYLLTGDEFDAQEGLRLGLVQEVVPADQLLTRAIEIAKRIAAQAPLAVQATIASARLSQQEGFEEAAKALLPTIQGLSKTSDCQEGVKAFFEKRAPNFTGC
jgi:acyl-CoA synthetase (AMP-forming)/AMP-acid ligase II/enoyl-CoA hydratase/carnithine racemase